MIKKLFLSDISYNYKKFLLIMISMFLSFTIFIVTDSFIKNVNDYISDDTKPIIWWDIQIRWNHILTWEWLSKLQNFIINNDLELSYKVQFFTNIPDKNWSFSLIRINWIDDKYPFYGKYDYDIIDKSAKNKIFVDMQTYDNFVKDWKINIWKNNLDVFWVVEKFPDAWISFFDEWRRVLIPYDLTFDLWLTDFWSRVEYYYIIKINDKNKLNLYIDLLKQSDYIKDKYSVSDFRNSVDQVSSILNDFDKYIKIILIISFLLVSVWIFFNIESFFVSESKKIWILKILWLKIKTLFLYYFIFFIGLYIISFWFSYLFSEIIFLIVREFDITKNFIIYGSSLWLSFLIWLVLLFSALSFPLVKFVFKWAVFGLKDDIINIYTSRELIIQFFIMFIGIFLIYFISIWWFIDSLFFALIVLIIIILFSFLLKFLLNKLFKLWFKIKNNNFIFFDAIRSTISPWNISIIIILSLFMTIISIFVSSYVSISFIQKLKTTSQDQPNVFIINLNDKNIQIIKDKYNDNKYFDIILWKIILINELPLNTYLNNTNPSREFTREFNITTKDLAKEIIEWKRNIWFWELSIDQDFASRLNVNIWDFITFLISWRNIKLKIVAIRDTQKNWTNPFFFFQFNAEQFKNAPKTFFWPVKVDNNIDEYISKLRKEIGDNIVVIKIWDIIKLVENLVYKIVLVIDSLLLYMLVLWFITIYSSSLSIINLKKNKKILYKILWANKDFVFKNINYEYLYLIWMSFLLAFLSWFFIVSIIVNYIPFLDFSFTYICYSFLIIFIILILNLIMIKFIINRFFSERV